MTVQWRKSSRSNNGTCVEVAMNLSGVVAVRDSKDPAGPILAVTPAEWQVFLAGLCPAARRPSSSA